MISPSSSKREVFFNNINKVAYRPLYCLAFLREPSLRPRTIKVTLNQMKQQWIQRIASNIFNRARWISLLSKVEKYARSVFQKMFCFLNEKRYILLSKLKKKRAQNLEDHEIETMTLASKRSQRIIHTQRTLRMYGAKKRTNKKNHVKLQRDSFVEPPVLEAKSRGIFTEFSKNYANDRLPFSHIEQKNILPDKTGKE